MNWFCSHKYDEDLYGKDICKNFGNETGCEYTGFYTGGKTLTGDPNGKDWENTKRLRGSRLCYKCSVSSRKLTLSQDEVQRALDTTLKFSKPDKPEEQHLVALGNWLHDK